MRTPQARGIRFRHWALVVVAGLMLAMAGTPAGATTADDEFFDGDAKAVLDWSVPDRYAASWSSYSPATGYDLDFVNPRSWTLNLNGCGSTSVRRITSYTFTVAQLGTAWTQTKTSLNCSTSLAGVPAQGFYRVSPVLRTDMGIAPGVSAPANRIAEIRDYLIVSMGDSLASGEGNPDVPGSYSFDVDASFHPVSIRTNRAAQWKDRRCHRSVNSGPSLAAKAYEAASPYTSVTFVSVACSGAELRHLISDSYGGIQPDGTTFVPQVNAISALVGPASRDGGRSIDALLIAAGLNNLGFSDIIERCAFTINALRGHEKCVTDGDIASKLEDLRRQYAYLALALKVKLPNAREIYLNDYPSNVFNGGACGLLGIAGIGIDDVEADEMDIQGSALTSKITQATDVFRDYHWNRIGPLNDPFHSHAYCDSASWFTTLEKSVLTQGDINGTAHPNVAGHVTYGNLIQRAMVPGQGSQPYHRLTVTIEAVKAATVSGANAYPVNPVLIRYQNDTYGLTHALSVPRNGQWTPVSAAAGVFTLDVFAAPASPRRATELTISFAHILRIHHAAADGFGAGTHELTHPTGSLAVRYRVVAQTPGPPGVG